MLNLKNFEKYSHWTQSAIVFFNFLFCRKFQLNLRNDSVVWIYSKWISKSFRYAIVLYYCFIELHRKFSEWQYSYWEQSKTILQRWCSCWRWRSLLDIVMRTEKEMSPFVNFFFFFWTKERMNCIKFCWIFPFIRLQS